MICEKHPWDIPANGGCPSCRAAESTPPKARYRMPKALERVQHEMWHGEVDPMDAAMGRLGPTAMGRAAQQMGLVGATWGWIHEPDPDDEVDEIDADDEPEVDRGVRWSHMNKRR